MKKGTFIAAEPEALERFSAPWDLMIDSPGDAAPCAELQYFAIPGLTVMREEYRRPARLIGMPPQDELILGIPLGNARGSTVYGREVVPRQIYSLAGSALEARYQSGQQVLAIHLDLAQEFGGSLELAIDRLLDSNGTVAIGRPGAETDRLIGCLSAILECSQPQASVPAAQLVSAISQSVMAVISDAVLPERLDGIDGKTSSQSRVVTAALEYLRASSDCASVSELCAGAGVGQRTLERGVRARFDCTVVQLLQKWRLHKARQGLVRSGPGDTTVSRVAASLGFYDFGRFASLYSTAFGEYPSVTLASASTTSVVGPLAKKSLAGSPRGALPGSRGDARH